MLLVFLFLLIRRIVAEYHCDPLNHPVIPAFNSDYRMSLLYNKHQQETENLRIHLEYDQDFEIRENAEDIKKHVINPAVENLQEILKPKTRCMGPLRFTGECFGNREFVTIGDEVISVCEFGCTESFMGIDLPKKYLSVIMLF